MGWSAAFGQNDSYIGVASLLKQHCPVCTHYNKELPLIKGQEKETKDGISQPDFVSFHNMHVQLHEKKYEYVLPYILASITTYSETSKNDTLLYLSYYAKGSFYRKTGLADQSLTSMLQAQKISERMEEPPGRINLYSDIGNLFFELKKYENALQFYLDLLEQNDFSTNKKMQGTLYNNIARCYANIEAHDYEKSELYYKKSLAFYKTLNDSLNLATVYLNLGDLYFEQYNDSQAIAHLKQALLYSQIQEAADIRGDIYFNLSLATESTGDTKKALMFYKKYVEQLENVWNRDKVWKLAEQEKKFIVDKKQSEIKLLEKDAKLQKITLEGKKMQSNTFFTIASVLLFLLLIGIYAYRQRLKKNKVIAMQNLQLDELNKTKDRLFSIIAHDLRTPVHLLRESNLKLKNALEEKAFSILDKQVDFNIRMTENTYSMLDNLLYWSLEQKKKFFFKKETLPFASVIDQVLMNYTEALRLKNIKLEKYIPADLLISADSNALKIALRNIIDNAIKFTHDGGHITIIAHAHENEAKLVIKDTGIGVKKSVLETLFNSGTDIRQKDTYGRISTGLGLELCKIMAEKNGGVFVFESEEGKGTSVSMTFELVKNYDYVKNSHIDY